MNEMAKKKESTPGENLAKQIIEQYKPKSVADMQDALKDIFGPMFEAMLQGEMNSHLGYESNDHGAKSTITVATAIPIRKSGQVQERLKSKCLVTEIQALNRSLCQSGKRMYLK